MLTYFFLKWTKEEFLIRPLIISRPSKLPWKICKPNNQNVWKFSWYSHPFFSSSNIITSRSIDSWIQTFGWPGFHHSMGPWEDWFYAQITFYHGCQSTGDCKLHHKCCWIQHGVYILGAMYTDSVIFQKFLIGFSLLYIELHPEVCFLWFF